MLGGADKSNGDLGTYITGADTAGRYWIVDRPTGGIGSQALTWAKDFVNRTDHATWFALYRDDHRIDDFTWINSVKRGQFRLHPIGPARLSLGCITLYKRRGLCTTPGAAFTDATGRSSTHK
ncbi:DUF2778 domain-containing protein [Serratia ficaria]|uniref:DUF2778 domain-containing protein n=1 Tax=Serratia ficaria TaxID=61651 RepID=UPI0021B792F6|nr:DUF2778 domain-containing protein [Serratia ficaria]